jgi:hypothetical protein
MLPPKLRRPHPLLKQRSCAYRFSAHNATYPRQVIWHYRSRPYRNHGGIRHVRLPLLQETQP